MEISRKKSTKKSNKKLYPETEEALLQVTNDIIDSENQIEIIEETIHDQEQPDTPVLHEETIVSPSTVISTSNVTQGRVPVSDPKLSQASMGIKKQIYWFTKMAVKTYRYPCAKEVVNKMVKCVLPHIANALHTVYNDSIIYTDNGWYEFNGNKWVLKDRTPTSINRHFNIFMLENMMNNIHTGNSESNRAKDKIILGISEFTNREIINSLTKERFKSPSVLKKLETMNNNVLVFTNGTYSIKERKFRESKATDYCIRSLNYAFTLFDESNPLVKKLEDYMNQIVPDINDQNVLLNVLSSFINDYKKDKILVFVKLTRSSGMSVFIDFLYRVFGEYSDKFTVIHNNTINEKYIDYLRDGSRNEGTIVVCNDHAIDIKDPLCKDHIAIINWQTRFTNESKEKKDPLMIEKLEELIPVFMFALLQMY